MRRNSNTNLSMRNMPEMREENKMSEEKIRFKCWMDGIERENKLLTAKEITNKLKQKWIHNCVKNTDEMIIQIGTSFIPIQKTVNKPFESENLLDTAKGLIYSERAKQYGSFKDNNTKIINIFRELTGINLTEEQCAYFLISLKLARQGTRHKRDNLIDIAGYVGLLDDMKGRK